MTEVTSTGKRPGKDVRNWHVSSWRKPVRINAAFRRNDSSEIETSQVDVVTLGLSPKFALSRPRNCTGSLHWDDSHSQHRRIVVLLKHAL